VSDGWHLADGKLCYMPPPLVRAVAIGSLLPRREQIDHVIAELAKAPQDELREWQRLGGVVDVIAGADARRHPKSPVNIIAGAHCGGWYSLGQQRIVVAADSPIQPPVVTLHEFGHALDASHALSTGSYWRSVIGGPDRAEAFGLGEQFAESFGRYYHGDDTRRMLPWEVQEYFQRTIT